MPWDRVSSDFISYFCKYFSGGSSSFYDGNLADSPKGEKIKRMTFVTDGYFPPSSETANATNDDDKDFDLADDDYQPFPRERLKASGTRLEPVLVYSDKTANRLAKGLSRLGLALLWDYLDTDNVPLSLAIPSVERVPMVVGVSHTLNGTIKVVKTSAPSSGNPSDDDYEYKKNEKQPTAGARGSRTVAQVETFVIDPASFKAAVDPGVVEATLAYPFRRDESAAAFQVDGHLALFFSSATMGLRVSNGDVLRLNGGEAFINETSIQNGVFHFKLDQQSVSFPSVTKQADAVKKVQLVAKQNGALMTELQNTPLLTVVYEWEQTKDPPTEANPNPSWTPATRPDGSIVKSLDGYVTTASTRCGYPALAATGKQDENFSDSQKLVTYLQGAQGTTFTLNAAVWLRVLNDEGKTVDLVPAHFKDDLDYNSINNQVVASLLGNKCGGDYPLMRFAGASIPFSTTALGSVNAGFAFAPAGVMCSDPRWNWAPEHWWKAKAVDEVAWLLACGEDATDASGANGDDGRSRDIFMATSDAGYMQSVYELAMLPRLAGDLRAYGDSEVTGNMEDLGAMTDWPAAFGDTKNRSRMWKTYCPYARTGFVRDYFENVGNVTGRIVCEGGGSKVNPYSDSTNVVMAAFANTPTDWWAAAAQAESDVGVAVNVRKNAEQFNKTYAFNEMASSSVSKFAWNDLRQVAMNYIQKVHASNDANVDWEACFDNLDWDGENSEFCGIDALEKNPGLLSDVDRRFLYGFWRECFAARQQLFLVFVRAEPQMLGGGTARQVPPQLGVRAVALVWRDPTATTDDKTPHRTRVLFYRQFE